MKPGQESRRALKSVAAARSLINNPGSDGNRDPTIPDLAQRGSMENGMRVNNGELLRMYMCLYVCMYMCIGIGWS